MKLFWLPVDGVMGLGWPALSAFHARPPVSNILPQLTEPLFTIYLASHLDESNAHDGGLITLGVAYLGIPISFVYPIMQELNTTWNFDFNEYEVDCKLQKGGPALIFDLQNNIFQVPSNQYIRKFKLESQDICLLSILEQYSVAFVPSWALGYPFLRSYCSVYDFGNARIGFALPLNM
ncbi:unnamed protein product [Thelazia callipaeda]|uniref:Peptidase A1 domain-containing protein n=1 Tax=Thelazia callipaeda TaxID=103827 RepID=A0A0N5DC05_THECL|nr:unnamed protein product [Thelazia callipaeda]